MTKRGSKKAAPKKRAAKAKPQRKRAARAKTPERVELRPAEPVAPTPEPTTPRKPGRRRILELTPEITDALAALIERGMPLTHACARVGIADGTLHDWVARGDKGEPMFAEFSEAIRCARAAKVDRLLADIDKAGSIPSLITGQVDWKAKAWILEHTEPDTFRAPTQRTELTGKDGKAIQVESMADVMRVALAEPETVLDIDTVSTTDVRTPAALSDGQGVAPAEPAGAAS